MADSPSKPGAERRYSTDAQLAEALVAADLILIKAAASDPFAPYVALERRLFKTLLTAFTRAAKVAVREAVERARQGDPDERPTKADVEAVRQRVDRAFQNWHRGTEAIVESVIRATYREGKTQAAARANNHPINRTLRPRSPHLTLADLRKAKPKTTFEIKPRFQVVDEAAVAAMKDHQLYWIGNHYTANVSNRVAQIAEGAMITDGFSRREAAKALEAGLIADFGYDPKQPFGSAGKFGIPGKWNGSPIQYFEGLAANTVTTARIAGQVQEYKEVGASLIEIIATTDDRMCEVCGFMNGKVFPLEGCAAQVSSLQGGAVGNPNWTKDIQPWRSMKQLLSASKGMITASDKGRVLPHKAEVLTKIGQQLPPYHFRCRCTTDIAPDATFKPYAEIPEEAPPAVAPPPPSAPIPPPAAPGSPISAPLPKPPPPKPEPIVSPGAAPESPLVSDFPYAEGDLKKVPMRLNGMHTKEVYEAPDGSKWLFKPQTEFRARGDVLAADMADACGLETPKVYLTKVGGRTGSIQRMYDDVASDYYGIAPSTLTETDASIIQQQHLFDWLISQHDTHGGNLLRLKNGHTVFIDKGQAFRFFGDDTLTLGYGAAGTPNPSETYYYRMFQEAIEGKGVPLVGFEHRRIQRFISIVESMPDSAFARIIRPYALAAEKEYKLNAARMGGKFWMKKMSAEDFIKQAIARKRGLRDAAQRFYADLDSKLHPVTPSIVTQPAAAPMQIGRGAVQKIDDAFVKEIIESKWAGKAVMIGGPDFEEMQLLAYQVKNDGFYMEGKLRKDALKKVQKVFESPPRGYTVERLDFPRIPFREFDPKTREIVLTSKTSNLRRAEVVWKIETPSGVTIEYVPPVAENTKQTASAVGQFTMRIQKTGDVTLGDVQQMLTEIRELGLESRIATGKDIELLYLRMVAMNKGFDKEANLIRETLSQDTQITRLRTMLGNKGVPLDPARGFDPAPLFENGKFGRAYWRAPISADEEAFLKANQLMHNITGDSGGDVAKSLDRILSGTEGLVSTEEKIRTGIGISGMSPEADRKTGGAVNVFTRIKASIARTEHPSEGATYWFRSDLMRRTTTFSYDADRYGSVKATARSQRLTMAKPRHQGSWLDALLTSSNETMIRNSINFRESLEGVVTRTLADRDAVLGVLKKHGIKTLGGQPIEEAVKVAH